MHLMVHTLCRLRLLQSTLIGVVLLHLLLVPGIAFLAGAGKEWASRLPKRGTELNHSLLAIG